MASDHESADAPAAGQSAPVGHDPVPDPSVDPEVVGFRGPQVCEIVGITYRQLDYWARTDLLRPSLADARGSGSQRLYSYRDLLELKVIKNVLDAGIALQQARKAVVYLREQLGEDVSKANLVISGKQVLLARTPDEVLDLLQQGQGVLNVVALSGVREEVDAAIHELFPDRDQPDRDQPDQDQPGGLARPDGDRWATPGAATG